MASFYVWNSSLGWYGLKLTFTSFTITCDKKTQHNFTDAYKRNYIIKSWQTENAFLPNLKFLMPWIKTLSFKVALMNANSY